MLSRKNSRSKSSPRKARIDRSFERFSRNHIRSRYGNLSKFNSQHSYNRSTNCGNWQCWPQVWISSCSNRRTHRIIEVAGCLPFSPPTLRYRLHADAVISSLVGWGEGQKGSGERCFQRQDSAIMLTEWKCCLREKGNSAFLGREDPSPRSISFNFRYYRDPRALMKKDPRENWTSKNLAQRRVTDWSITGFNNRMNEYL